MSNMEKSRLGGCFLPVLYQVYAFLGRKKGIILEVEVPRLVFFGVLLILICLL